MILFNHFFYNISQCCCVRVHLRLSLGAYRNPRNCGSEEDEVSSLTVHFVIFSLFSFFFFFHFFILSHVTHFDFFFRFRFLFSCICKSKNTFKWKSRKRGVLYRENGTQNSVQKASNHKQTSNLSHIPSETCLKIAPTMKIPNKLLNALPENCSKTVDERNSLSHLAR